MTQISRQSRDQELRVHVSACEIPATLDGHQALCGVGGVRRGFVPGALHQVCYFRIDSALWSAGSDRRDVSDRLIEEVQQLDQ
jgi:hypothetical protein